MTDHLGYESTIRRATTGATRALGKPQDFNRWFVELELETPRDRKATFEFPRCCQGQTHLDGPLMTIIHLR